MSLGEFQEGLCLGQGLSLMTMRPGSVALILLGLLIGTAAVHAHARLDRAIPQPDSTVRTAPNEVTLWFTQKLDPSFSSC
jgi:copper resistance protein C